MERHTRARLNAFAVTVALAIAGLGLARGADAPEQTGVFALHGGSPQIVSKLQVENASGTSATLKLRQFQLDGKTPILNYDVEMERVMHMIVVRDDFGSFDHLHPVLDAATGTFSQSFTHEPNHRYYVYADTTPHGIGQQVFRFTLGAEGPIATSHPPAAPSAVVTRAGPYVVTLTAPTLSANQSTSVVVTILENGAPARDLGTYLGAAAHAVFINTSTLEYVHVHPTVRGATATSEEMHDSAMHMSAQAGPLLQMAVPPLPSGTYRVWLEFRGASDRVYTAPFTLVAR